MDVSSFTRLLYSWVSDHRLTRADSSAAELRAWSPRSWLVCRVFWDARFFLLGLTMCCIWVDQPQTHQMELLDSDNRTTSGRCFTRDTLVRCPPPPLFPFLDLAGLVVPRSFCLRIAPAYLTRAGLRPVQNKLANNRNMSTEIVHDVIEYLIEHGILSIVETTAHEDVYHFRQRPGQINFGALPPFAATVRPPPSDTQSEISETRSKGSSVPRSYDHLLDTLVDSIPHQHQHTPKHKRKRRKDRRREKEEQHEMRDLNEQLSALQLRPYEVLRQRMRHFKPRLSDLKSTEIGRCQYRVSQLASEIAESQALLEAYERQIVSITRDIETKERERRDWTVFFVRAGTKPLHWLMTGFLFVTAFVTLLVRVWKRLSSSQQYLTVGQFFLLF
ncbi:uncharacterized protein MONBRDRAFT_11613 [Monosiga brevicollis MX1]|uniref:Uncharacterized protein n=1 Tax=Monosiga brevicollis TaxID=81824 RepID=A9V9S8_MONBE|nr:uncharacterized protein MONBRDRAFT_11613 [Monosiga brevicollis MX1]EDQ85776.1 predicted protein [Monosiga brevicollis MX1]|eukprot:XP_001749491.1 hypothetical protein [Monosiga brevicollis MX1]